MQNEIGCASEEETRFVWEYYKDSAHMYIGFEVD